MFSRGCSRNSHLQIVLHAKMSCRHEGWQKTRVLTVWVSNGCKGKMKEQECCNKANAIIPIYIVCVYLHRLQVENVVLSDKRRQKCSHSIWHTVQNDCWISKFYSDMKKRIYQTTQPSVEWHSISLWKKNKNNICIKGERVF